MHPDLGHGPRRAQPDGGGFVVAEQIGECLDGAHREGRDPAEGRLEGGVARRLVLGLERASSVSQRRSVFSPMPQRAAALPIVGSDRSATIACSRTAAVFAPWPTGSCVRTSAVICGRLGGVGMPVVSGCVMPSARVLNLCSDAMQHSAELRQFPQIPAFITPSDRLC